MGEIQLCELTKSFAGESGPAVAGVSLDIQDGEFLVLVGPSGCGKSTLLRMIAGIEDSSSGHIVIDGREVTYAQPKDRDVAMIFQNYALYPHMTVAENLEFALRLRRVDRKARKARVAEVLSMLRLEGLDSRKPGQLSGGQRQRVAMGRAIVREPAAFLMDEPLSNLDAKLRVSMRAELSRLHERIGTTTIYVTHDQTEAMTLGQRVAVLSDGQLQQVDTPMRLFDSPRSVFVASFIGSPAMNFAQATVVNGRLHFGGYALPVPAGVDLGRRQNVIVGLRPSDFAMVPGFREHEAKFSVAAEVVENLGAETHVIFGVDTTPVGVSGASGHAADDTGDGRLLADGRSLFTAAIDTRRLVRPGERLELYFDLSRLQLFDCDSSRALDVLGRADVGQGGLTQLDRPHS